jgi:hypothetical protein
MKKFTLLLSFCLLLTLASMAQWPGSGGPDTYGYRFATFNSSDARYNWVDITTKGVEVFNLADDNSVGPFDIGFDFQYYWYTVNSFHIGSNGFISFERGFNIASTAIGFPTTPTADENNDLLAPFMCDLSFSGSGNPGRCYYYKNEANDSLVVSFINVPFWTNNTAGYAGSNSFQIILAKADSSIKYQYLNQSGVWNSSYDMTTNPMMVGIENRTGNIGLAVANNIYPSNATGVVFDAPASSPLQILDGLPVSVANDESGGFFIPWPGAPYSFSADIGNFGNADFTSPTTVRARAIDTLGQTFYQTSAMVGPLMAGQVETVQLTPAFNPPLSGPYSLTVSTDTVSEGIFGNPTNNVKVVEAVVTDTTGGVAKLTFSSENVLNITGSSQWQSGGGNSGIGVYYEPTGYPAKITSVELYILPSGQAANDTMANGSFWIGIYDDDPIFGTVPGAPLFLDTVEQADVDIYDAINTPTRFGAWNKIELPVPIEITEGGFYIGWYHLNDSLSLANENAAPISRRTYEVLGGTWASHRSATTQDSWIRVNTDVSGVTRGVAIDDEMNGLSRFDVFPNPSSGQLNIDVELAHSAPLQVAIFNLQGSKVYLQNMAATAAYKENLDLSHLPAGMYVVQVSTPTYRSAKKVVIK